MPILMDTMDIQFFDDKGKLITKMNHTMQAILDINDNDSFFHIQDSKVNIELLKSLAKSQDNQTDFDKAKDKTVSIKFSKNSASKKFYKIVANGVMYDEETSKKSHDFNLVIHNAKLISGIQIDGSYGKVFTPDYSFQLFEDLSLNFVDLDLTEV